MKTKRQIAFVLVLLGSLFLVTAALAAPTDTTVDRYVIGGGGGSPEAVGIYALTSTIGQPVVGGLDTDPYELGSGFWGGMGAVARVSYPIYLPLTVRSYSP